LSHDFNQPLLPDIFPSSLKRLHFGQNFNQYIPMNVLPPNLTYLHFGRGFEGRITTHMLPKSLTHVFIRGVSMPRSVIWKLLN